MADNIFTDQNFDQEVSKSNVPVLVDFWAPWCGPCRVVGPIVEEIAKDYQTKAKIGKLNVDENPKIASQYGIMSIPTLMIFRNGQIVKTMVGVQSKETLKEELDNVLS